CHRLVHVHHVARTGDDELLSPRDQRRHLIRARDRCWIVVLADDEERRRFTSCTRSPAEASSAATTAPTENRLQTHLGYQDTFSGSDGQPRYCRATQMRHAGDHTDRAVEPFVLRER